MSLLLSNDDGVHAGGIIALREILEKQHEVMVIAPDRDRSGVSNSLTLDHPLQAKQLADNIIAVDGTPTDCIHLGTAGIFMAPPTQVLSGINQGANLGDDVLYSGTLAAAMEGRFLARPAMALSLVTSKSHTTAEDYRQAAQISLWLMKQMANIEIPPRTILNINIPDLPMKQIKGVKLTSLGQRLQSESPVITQNPRGKTLYWIGRSGGPVEKLPGSDFHAIDEGYISVTPVHSDMSALAALKIINEQSDTLDKEFSNLQRKFT